MPQPSTEEHEVFRRSLRSFVEREVAPYVTRWEQDREIDRGLFPKLAELGALGVRMPERFGGGGHDFWYTKILIEELVACGAAGVAVSVLAHAEFSTKVIESAGTPEQCERFLRPAIAGHQLGALGVSEPDAGSDVGAIRTTAVADGDTYVVNGSKTFITNGGIADFVTTLVRTGGPGHRGLSLLVIPTQTPGLSRGKQLQTVGTRASNTAQLHFEDCRVPSANRIGPEGGGFKLLMRGFEAERLVLAVICCSQMRGMWTRARAYGHERWAFGQRLLDFQVWRHRLADTLTTIHAAEALTDRAIDLHVRGQSCNAEISMAKLFASESSVRVAHDCAQIFGGNAYMEEFPIARMRRDALAFSIGAGTSEVMREIIARTSGLEVQGGAT